MTQMLGDGESCGALALVAAVAAAEKCEATAKMVAALERPVGFYKLPEEGQMYDDSNPFYIEGTTRVLNCIRANIGYMFMTGCWRENINVAPGESFYIKDEVHDVRAEPVIGSEEKDAAQVVSRDSASHWRSCCATS